MLGYDQKSFSPEETWPFSAFLKMLIPELNSKLVDVSLRGLQMGLSALKMRYAEQEQKILVLDGKDGILEVEVDTLLTSLITQLENNPLQLYVRGAYTPGRFASVQQLQEEMATLSPRSIAALAASMQILFSGREEKLEGQNTYSPR